MVTINILKQDLRIVSFEFEGHAEYAPHGSDIVCAAISMAAHMLITGLECVAQKAPKVTSNSNGGYMMIELHDSAHVQVHTLANTLEISLKCLANQYPENIQVLTRDT